MTSRDFSNATDGTRVISEDPWLEPFESVLKERYARFQGKIAEIETNEQCSLVEFAGAYKTMGIHKVAGGILYKEWVPTATAVSLIGDFNGWNNDSHYLRSTGYGKWEIFLPDQADGTPAIPHNSRVKVCIRTHSGQTLNRIPPYINYAKQEPNNPAYDGVFWNPPAGDVYKLVHPRPNRPSRLRIYEAHIGMASDQPVISTYKHFKDVTLPYIVNLGYNAIQLMAIMEHSYYASFGYQVTNFFAPSSRYGNPEELRAMVDEAHRLGLCVFLDVVHSHASKNSEDGLNLFDGTDHCYFHGGGKGNHDLWDSRLFNYGSWETMRFLLSNLRYWVEEFGFDGFRFDGVTSMVYYSHGIGSTPMSYGEHFGPGVDSEAVLYLTLANHMLQTLLPNVITISEDVSGFATMCRPIEVGGLGFDYRLGMGIPDKWIELMKVKDDDWNIGNISFTLTNRRWKEATIAYVESHDQALVGDKTIAFWLMDKDMYTDMTVLKDRTPTIDRGFALHKMLRFITMCLGGEAYLNFMGNEFGHPEWIDFPRPGNNWSYHHARRRFDLVSDHLLRYKALHLFDKKLNHFEETYSIMNRPTFVSLKHEGDKLIVFERGPILFVFNFHPTQSFPDYRIGVEAPGTYRIALDTDWSELEGLERNNRDTKFFTEPKPWNDRSHSMQIYIPNRCGLAFVPDS